MNDSAATGEQTFLIQAVLADSRGVWLSPSCPTCDHDLRDQASIVCSKCDLEFCAKICWGLHVDAHEAGTAFTPVRVTPPNLCFTCDRDLRDCAASCSACYLEFCAETCWTRHVAKCLGGVRALLDRG